MMMMIICIQSKIFFPLIFLNVMRKNFLNLVKKVRENKKKPITIYITNQSKANQLGVNTNRVLLVDRFIYIGCLKMAILDTDYVFASCANNKNN